MEANSRHCLIRAVHLISIYPICATCQDGVDTMPGMGGDIFKSIFTLSGRSATLDGVGVGIPLAPPIDHAARPKKPIKFQKISDIGL